MAGHHDRHQPYDQAIERLPGDPGVHDRLPVGERRLEREIQVVIDGRRVLQRGQDRPEVREEHTQQRQITISRA